MPKGESVTHGRLRMDFITGASVDKDHVYFQINCDSIAQKVINGKRCISTADWKDFMALVNHSNNHLKKYYDEPEKKGQYYSDPNLRKQVKKNSIIRVTRPTIIDLLGDKMYVVCEANDKSYLYIIDEVGDERKVGRNGRGMYALDAEDYEVLQY